MDLDPDLDFLVNHMNQVKLEERLEKQHGVLGVLNIALIWYDTADLDLHVTCPCKPLLILSKNYALFVVGF